MEVRVPVVLLAGVDAWRARQPAYSVYLRLRFVLTSNLQ
jgi:hypothetical protein